MVIKILPAPPPPLPSPHTPGAFMVDPESIIGRPLYCHTPTFKLRLASNISWECNIFRGVKKSFVHHMLVAQAWQAITCRYYIYIYVF